MTKLLFWVATSLTCFLLSCSGNQENPPIHGEDFCSIDSLFNKYIDAGEIAGASALIARHGEILYYSSIGYSNLEEQKPLQKDAIFFIASQTKAITSVAVMMLWEEGKFDLDDPLSKFLPEFAFPHLVAEFDLSDSSYTPIPADREPTIRHLLTHTSGYPYPNNPDKSISAIYAKNKIFGGIPDRNTTLKEEIQKIAAMPLLHEPGEAYTYGLSTDILGYLVETVSGISLEEFFQQQIFDPLGMKDTYFRLPDDKLERLMTLYSEDPATGELLPQAMDTRLFKADKYLFSGGGGLLSTAMDYHIFQQMILDGGIYMGTRLLEEETVAMMTRNQIGKLEAGSLFLQGKEDKFGLGFEILSPPGAFFSSIPIECYGWGGAFGSLYWMDPVNNLTINLVIQKAGEYGALRQEFIDAVYKAIYATNKAEHQKIVENMDWSKIRFAYSADGFNQDRDDVAGSAMSLALFDRGGFHKQLVHYHFNTNFGGPPKHADEHRRSVLETGVLFGFIEAVDAKDGFFDVSESQEEKSAAINHLASEIINSAPDRPLWVFCGGGVQVPYAALSKAIQNGAGEPALRSVTFISHSPPNEWTSDKNHEDPSMHVNWVNLVRLSPFPAFFNYKSPVMNENKEGGMNPDQNSTAWNQAPRAKRAGMDAWLWLDGYGEQVEGFGFSGNKGQWLLERLAAAGRPELGLNGNAQGDASDAGMVFAVIPGGNSDATMEEIREYFGMY